MDLLLGSLLAVLANAGSRGPVIGTAAALKHGLPTGLVPAVISGLTATPGTVAFTATDPDLGSVSGTPTATVTWSALGGVPVNTWTLSVQAGASAFSGCATVPVSAVTVTCTAASSTGTGGTGTCSGPFTLSTSAHQVASGAEGTASGNYSVSIAFTLADSWKYVAAAACTLTLTYTASTP